MARSIPASTDGSWTASRVLVTGASGVLGTALKAELADAGFGDVVAVSSADADLTDAAAAQRLLAVHAPALVFHLAARVSGIMGNMKNQGRAFLDNVRINTNVIEAARLSGVRKIVALGTTAIYSDQAPLPKREDDLWLGPPHGSEAGYGHAKRAMLAQLESYRDQYGLDYAYCISTNLFGPGDRFDEEHGHVVPSLISKFHRGVTTGEAVEVWGSGTPQRDFLYARDAAAALRIIAERGSGAINLVSGRTITIRACVETIAAIAGYTRPVVWNRDKPDGQLRREYDVSRLAALGFAPRIGVEQGLRDTYAWYAAHADTARR